MVLKTIPKGVKLPINEGVDLINAAIEAADKASTDSADAKTTAEQALSKSEDTQTQLDQVVIDGDSSVEAAQARVDADGNSYDTLKKRLDSEHSDVTSQLAENSSQLSNHASRLESHDSNFEETFNVTALRARKGYGVVGDGVSDDMLSLQSMFDNCVHEKVILESGKNYLITGGLNIDTNKVKGIDGNGSTIIMGDTVANGINIFGSMTEEMTANPNSITPQILENEKDYFIENIRITSKNQTGTAINISNTIAVNVDKVGIYNVSDGIVYENKNRNATISNSHIYNCLNDGVRTEKGDLHQINIVNNHISYCKNPLHVNDTALFNMQISGNDIEIADQPAAVENILKVRSVNNKIEDIELTGNTIEDHWQTQALINLDADVRGYINVFTMSGNSIGNGKGADLKIRKATGVTVAGNAFKRSNGYSIVGSGYVENLIVTGNTFQEPHGIFHYQGGDDDNQNTLINVTISNNTIQNINWLAFKIEGFALYNVQISNNSLFYVSDKPTGFPDDYVFALETLRMQGVNVTQNIIKARDYISKVMYVTPDQPLRAIFIKDNSVLSAPTGSSTIYTLPDAEAGNIVIENNINTA